MREPLQVLVDDVKTRQLDAIRIELAGVMSGHAGRLSAGTRMGLEIMNRVAQQHTNAGLFVRELVSLAATDDRFAFLRAIPDGPVLSMMRALALEQTVFSETTDAVAELALLMGLFTVLLDGLLDEVPDELAPIKSRLDDVMLGQSWGDARRSLPLSEAAESSHPVAELTVWLANEVVRRIVTQPVWQRDDILRREFRAATAAAYTAEVRSTAMRISTGARADAGERVIEKSASCIWAGALIPFCIHGWPTDIDPREFEALARAVGAYGGWIDDVVDILVDLRADRWSAVLLELDSAATSLGAHGTVWQRLALALYTPMVVDRLPHAGVARLRIIREQLRMLRLREDVLLPAIGDMTTACLTDGSDGVAA